MKKILVFASLISLFFLVGCSVISPSSRVEALLNKYIKNDKDITDELKMYLSKQELSETQRNRYERIIKNEYATITYDIKNETIDKDSATVEVDISVKDLYKASITAENELLDHPEKFYNDGVYDANKYIDYKLDLMERSSDKVNYTIYINLTKKNNTWVIDDIDDDTLEKIHGIYAYN